MNHEDAPDWYWTEQEHYEEPDPGNKDSLMASLQAIPDYEDAEAWFHTGAWCEPVRMHSVFLELMNWHQIGDETRVAEVAS